MEKIVKRRIDVWTILAVCAVITLAAFMLPMLIGAQNAHPIADDHGYSSLVHHAVEDGLGLGGVVNAAVQTVSKFYRTWQGSFAAMFIFALQPGAFSLDAYWLTTVLLLGGLLLTNFLLAHTVVVRWLRGRPAAAVLSAALISFVQVEFAPGMFEGFYWFNGGSYYTLAYAAAQVLAVLVIRMLLTAEKRRAWVLTVICLLPAVIIGGGNYTTALFCVELLVITTALTFMHSRLRALQLEGVTLVMLGCLILSVAAPGNAVRAAVCEGMSPAAAIIASFRSALACLLSWKGFGLLGYATAIAPAAVYCAARCRWRFCLPLIVLSLAVCLWVSQFTPPLYAMSNIGMSRQVNVYFFSLMLLVAFGEFYASGWLLMHTPVLKKLVRPAVALAVVAVGVLLIAVGYVRYVPDPATQRVVTALRDGSADAYDARYHANSALLEQGGGTVAISELPEVSYLSPISVAEDSDFWVNKQIAQYYRVDAVVLAPKK